MSRPRAAVVGFPVKHSLSPLIHGLWLRAAGVDGDYVTVEAPPDRFEAVIAELRSAGLRGVNVTVPHKEAALAFADRADASATAAGAANLLLFSAYGVEARNTDGFGMTLALAEQAPAWRPAGATVVILGAGGAARGAAAALRQAGVGTIRIVNRSLDRAQEVAEGVEGEAMRWLEMERAFDGATLVVNATTLGLEGVEPLYPVWPKPPAGAAALDMVYRPLRTAFLETAARAGWATADGLAMLIGQARPSFQALFGEAPSAEVDVRGACLDLMAQG
ncbi:shikimate dehydrogenase [soil metagenome]